MEVGWIVVLDMIDFRYTRISKFDHFPISPLLVCSALPTKQVQCLYRFLIPLHILAIFIEDE